MPIDFISKALPRPPPFPEIQGQVIAHTKPLYVCCGLMFVLGCLPGFPFFAFMALATLFFYLGRHSASVVAERGAAKIADEANKNRLSEGTADSIETMLHVDTLSLEVGVGLVPLVDTSQDGEVLERIVSSRKQFEIEKSLYKDRNPAGNF